MFKVTNAFEMTTLQLNWQTKSNSINRKVSKYSSRVDRKSWDERGIENTDNKEEIHNKDKNISRD